MASSSFAGEWKYVLPPPGDPHEHPPLRALGLRRERPDDVVERVHYRGNRQRYAQLRYGSPGSVRVTVVLDEAGPGEADLYVDADRNRRIESKDLVRGQGRTWRLPLDVAIVEGETTRLVRRAVIFRLGATGLTLSAAAAGYLEGTVAVGGRSHQARRTDGDGNGFLTDAQDRIWIDLDDDGRFDQAAEQFLYATILGLDGGRYAVRSDALGTRLAFEPLEGTGTLRLLVKRSPGAPRIAELTATLVGRDGSAVGLHGDGAEATVPIGEYRIGTVTATLDDPDGGPSWTFVFSDNGGKPEHVWHAVGKGASVTIDPIGAPDLGIELGDESKPCRAGDDLAVQPRLYTGDGLLINTCFRGSPTTPAADSGTAAQVALTTSDGRVLGAARSGFA